MGQELHRLGDRNSFATVTLALSIVGRPTALLNYSANELFAAKLFFSPRSFFPLRTQKEYEILLLYLGELWIERKMQLHLLLLLYSFSVYPKSPFWHSWLGLNLNFEYK